MEKEICICAAIKRGGKIFRGHRHGHAMTAMYDELMWDHTRREIFQMEEVQGFITSENRFVDREEGLKLQLAAGIKSADKDGYRNRILFSEDLY
jgi:hypothetical protein